MQTKPGAHQYGVAVSEWLLFFIGPVLADVDGAGVAAGGRSHVEKFGRQRYIANTAEIFGLPMRAGQFECIACWPCRAGTWPLAVGQCGRTSWELFSPG